MHSDPLCQIMRNLIDMIEKGAKSTSVEQAVDDIPLFANTASFLANALDTRLKSKDTKPNKKSKPTKTVGQPKPPISSIPKPSNTPKPQDTTTGMPSAISTAISQADYDRGSSHRLHKHLWEAVDNQNPLKTTLHFLRKSYSYRSLQVNLLPVALCLWIHS